MFDPLLAASAPPAHLPGILHSLEPTLDRFGYLSLGLIFLEDFGVPVPGETVLIIAAVYAGTGRLSIWLVALIGFIAAILGDNVGFAIGHFGGRPLAERYGKYIFLTPDRLDKTAKFFDRHGGKVIVIARFVEGLRQANGLIAGITGMHWKKFVLFNMLGAALWVAVWVSIGYFSGSNIDSIYKAATKYELFFGIAVGVLILAWIAHRVWKHVNGRADKIAALAEAGAPAEPPAVDEPSPTHETQATDNATAPTEAAANPAPEAAEPEPTEPAEPEPTEPARPRLSPSPSPPGPPAEPPRSPRGPPRDPPTP